MFAWFQLLDYGHAGTLPREGFIFVLSVMSTLAFILVRFLFLSMFVEFLGLWDTFAQNEQYASQPQRLLHSFCLHCRGTNPRI